jgi:inorganic triphosphatase YgiF
MDRDHPHARDGVETELRFVAHRGLPDGAQLERLSLAGMLLTTRGGPRLHSDVYLDTSRLRLRAAGANLRVRTGALGERWVTLKQKTRDGHKGALNIRLETEVELEHGDLVEESDPFVKARRLTSRRISPILQITTLREEHTFADAHGNEVLAALDVVTHPDGSVERRLEVELRAGAPQIMTLVERDVRASVRGLIAAPRGKRSEAIRRLPQLFR